MSTDSLDVEKWVRFAQMDFDSAVALAEKFRPPIEVVSYLCQQSAEKILKAYTIANTNILIKTHILKDLLKVSIQYYSDFDKFKVVCERLTPYITLARYPSSIEITEHDMKQALKDAQDVLDFTKSKLAEMGFGFIDS
jgi:HEPN domain-containing protein